jgi:hypothetical protein
MVIAIDKHRLDYPETPVKKRQRLVKISAKDYMEEDDEVDTNDDSWKDQQNKRKIKDSDYDFDIGEEE